MKYKVFYHKVKIENLFFTSAGIEALSENGKTIKIIYDVSTDFNALIKFVDKLNKSNTPLDELEFLLENYYLEHY